MDKTEKRLTLCLFAILMSHLGWVLEMLLFLFSFGIVADRGFITLPFCPIYGITLVVIYYLIGTPKSGGLLISSIGPSGARVILYFILATLIPTLAELIGGEIMEKISGRVLWDYTGMEYNFGKYISLESSLTWGALITGLMLPFDYFYQALSRVPKGIAVRLCGVFTSSVAIDFAVNLFFLSY